MRSLGIPQPGYAEWLAYCRRIACDPRLLRRPGFVTDIQSAYYAPERILPGREAARALSDGRIPVWSPRRENALREKPPTMRQYYADVLPPLYDVIREAWEDLDACERRRAMGSSISKLRS